MENTNDKNSDSFKEYTIPKVTESLNGVLVNIEQVIKRGDSKNLADVLVAASKRLNRSVVDAHPDDLIYSTPETAVMHAVGPIWVKPKNARSVEYTILNKLSERFLAGEIDRNRFANGVYFANVLLHKFREGNGRVARGLRAAVDKEGEGFTKEEVKRILGIGREILTQTDKETFRINFKPDLNNLILGVAYFALEKKGLNIEEVTGKLKLNGLLPEEGLQTLAISLGQNKDEIKKEFIEYMVVYSGLEWCNFE